MPEGEYYHFLQIRHFFQQPYAGPTSESTTFFEVLCHTSPCQKGLISGVYKMLESVDEKPTLKYRSQWEQDLHLDEGDMDWVKGWQNMRKVFVCQGDSYKTCDTLVLQPPAPEQNLSTDLPLLL